MAIPNCGAYAVSFRVTCSVFTILPHNYFHVFIFLFPPYVNWNGCLTYNKVLFHCTFHFLMWSLLLMLHPLIGPFIFPGSGLPLSISGAWSGSLSRAHIALQELQAVAIMLPRMAFCLSGKVVALHLDNSTGKAYLCNQGGRVSPFLSRLACQVLSLTDKHGITLLLAYMPTHLNVEADFLSWDQMLPELETLETPLPMGALGLNAFSHPWNFQVSYVFPPPALVPLVLSKFLAEHVNSQLRHLLLVAPCWMEAPWLPTVPNMVVDAP